VIVTTCEALAADLRGRYPDRAARIRCVFNGFDRADILPVAESNTTASREERSEFWLVAAGAFYGRREVARIVEPLADLLRDRPQWQGRVRFVLAGTLDAQQQRYWQRHRPAWMTLAGYVDHATAVAMTLQADCAVVVVPECRHGRMSIPGKTFELLALPTHILGLVPPSSETEAILRRAGGSTVAPFEDATRVRAAIEAIIAAHFDGTLSAQRDWIYVDRFDRRSAAQAFAMLLDDLCPSSGRSSPKRSDIIQLYPVHEGPAPIERARISEAPRAASIRATMPAEELAGVP